jgi:hypothetical protein
MTKLASAQNKHLFQTSPAAAIIPHLPPRLLPLQVAEILGDRCRVLKVDADEEQEVADQLMVRQPPLLFCSILPFLPFAFFLLT